MQYQRLGWKTFWIFVSERSQIAVAVGCIAVFVSIFATVPFVATIARFLILGFFAVLIITLVISAIEYYNWRYTLDGDALRIKKGILHIEDLAIPYRHIEDVDIERNILNRLTGTSSLVILTAGHTDADKEIASSEAEIPVMDHVLAQNIQAELIRRGNVQKVEEVAPAATEPENA